MTVTRNDVNRIKIANAIRAAGESLIKNADSIAGDEKYIIGVDIDFSIDCGFDEAPEIEVTKRFYPERLIDGFGKKE